MSPAVATCPLPHAVCRLSLYVSELNGLAGCTARELCYISNSTGGRGGRAPYGPDPGGGVRVWGGAVTINVLSADLC